MKGQIKKAYISPQVSLHPVSGQLMQYNSKGKGDEFLGKENNLSNEKWEE